MSEKISVACPVGGISYSQRKSTVVIEKGLFQLRHGMDNSQTLEAAREIGLSSDENLTQTQQLWSQHLWKSRREVKKLVV